MRLTTVIAATGLCLAGVTSAWAASGMAKGNVNLRTGPGTGYARLVTIPAGARVQVLRCPRWCEVVYAGRRGWASAGYIARGASGRARGGPYYVLPDKSLCNGPQAWTIPYCETPIERSINDFNQSNWNAMAREHRGGGRR